jgi:hypothetical protein
LLGAVNTVVRRLKTIIAKAVTLCDGVYGRISIFPKEGEAEKPTEAEAQMKLF